MQFSTSDICLSCLVVGWLLSNSCCVLGFLPNGLKLGWASNCAFRIAILTRNLPVYRIGLQQSGPSGDALGRFTDEHYGIMKWMTVCLFVRCHLLQKPWMVLGSAAAVALTAVTVAMLCRT